MDSMHHQLFIHLFWFIKQFHSKFSLRSTTTTQYHSLKFCLAQHKFEKVFNLKMSALHICNWLSLRTGCFIVATLNIIISILPLFTGVNWNVRIACGIIFVQSLVLIHGVTRRHRISLRLWTVSNISFIALLIAITTVHIQFDRHSHINFSREHNIIASISLTLSIIESIATFVVHKFASRM